MGKSSYFLNGNKVEFTIYEDMGIMAKTNFVDFVVGNVVDTENKRYRSFIRDVMFDFAIITFMTDIDTSTVIDNDDSFSDQISEIETFLHCIDISNCIKPYVKKEILDELNLVINQNIEYTTGIKLNDIGRSICSFIDALKKNIEEMDAKSLRDMAQIANKSENKNIANGIVSEYLKTNSPNDIKDEAAKAQKEKIIKLEDEIAKLKENHQEFSHL